MTNRERAEIRDAIEYALETLEEIDTDLDGLKLQIGEIGDEAKDARITLRILQNRIEKSATVEEGT